MARPLTSACASLTNAHGKYSHIARQTGFQVSCDIVLHQGAEAYPKILPICRERLRKIRAACPNILLQCLVRGANGVGYTSYADNVVEEFVVLAAKNGMDVFRIFDCFNIVDNMRVCIDAVKKTGKVAEVN